MQFFCLALPSNEMTWHDIIHQPWNRYHLGSPYICEARGNSCGCSWEIRVTAALSTTVSWATKALGDNFRQPLNRNGGTTIVTLW